MYSLVLLTAMASTGDAASFHWRSAGCGGCYGSGYVFHGGPVLRLSAPMTYSIGCYGAPAYTVVGGCSCSGYLSCSGCSGCTGCSGCWGSSFYSGYSFASCFGSCTGSCFGSYIPSVPVIDYTAPLCDGCALPGTITPVAPVITEPTTPTAPGTTSSTSLRPGSKPATLQLELPESSELYVEGQLIPGTGKSRSFSTPELPVGQSFVYEMKARVVIDGVSHTEKLKVVVHAGDRLEKSFGDLLALSASSKSSEFVKK